MKKILLLLALVMTVGAVNAKTTKLYSNFQPVANNNNVLWNSSANTLSVWGSSANTYQMFSFEAGTLSNCEKLYIPIDDTNYAHIRIMLMNGSGLVFTGRFGSGGNKTITLEGWNSYGSTLTKEQIATITSIRIGGYNVSSYSSESPCTISINPAETYLVSKEYEGNTTLFSSLRTGGTWPTNSLVSLPVTVSPGLQIVGKDNGVGDYADITDYHAIIFKITDFVTQGGGKIRAFICNEGDGSLTTRYAYPVSNTSVADWTAENGPSGNGYYYIDVTDYSRLVGIKINSYSTASDWKISEVYLVKKNLNITDGFDMADMVNDPIGATVNYDRAFDAGEKYTICLPFALTTAEVSTAGKFYELSSVLDDVLNFTTVTETVAYKPYIFVPSSPGTPFANLSDKEIAASSGATTTTEIAPYTFKGVLAATEDVKGDNEGKYVYGFRASDGTFVKVTGNSISVKAFRAYITVPEAKALSMGARSFMKASFGGGNGTTAIKKVETVSDDDPNAPVYNLAGQQVDASYKGIVIKNGKKYFQNK